MDGKQKQERPRIGITIGDINGVGPEVIIKTLKDNRILNHITPVIYGSTKTLSYYRKVLKVDDFNYSQVKNPGSYLYRKVNVVNCWEHPIEIQAGEETEEGGKASYLALRQAVKDVKDGLIDALVTAPINKNNIQNDEFNFPGHTEFLTTQFERQDSLMMMVGDNMKVGIVTGHMPLKEVSAAITAEKLRSKIKLMEQSLINDFLIRKPKIAVLGLNPHSGEEGLLGQEEQEIIKPVIQELKNKGKLVIGPFPADGFFGKGQYKNFDAVLAMYHDQGLGPFKALAFQEGVNFTAGLPVIRTSPDHGTAYAIAGKNVADPTSMRQSVYLALDIFKNRVGTPEEN